MTRNNLHENISWLLRNPNGTVPSDRIGFDPPPSQQTQNRSTADLGAGRGGDITVTAAVPMDRPASLQRTRRPGLLIAQQPSLLTPTPSDRIGAFQRANKESLANNERTLSPSKRKPRGEPVAQSPAKLKPASTPLEDEAIPLVDLTSSDALEEFGNDELVWTEDHASRPEPLPGSRTKRKSEDISSDVEAEIAAGYKKPRTPESMGRGTKSGIDKPQPDRTRVIQSTYPELPATEEKRLSQHHPASPSLRSSAAGTKAATSSSPSAAIRPQSSSSPPKAKSASRSPARANRSKSRSRLIVEDSDDEFLTPPSRTAPDADLSVADSGEVQDPDREPLPTNVDDEMVVDIDEMVVEDTPSKAAATSPEKRPQPPSRSMFDAFLDRPAALEDMRRKVEELIKENSKEFERACREHWSKEQRDGVRARRGPLLERQKALNCLQSEYQSFQTLSNERESLLARIAVAYDADIDIDDEERQLDDINKQIDDLKETISRRLEEAGATIESLSEMRSTVPASRAMPPPQRPSPKESTTFSQETTLLASQAIPETQPLSSQNRRPEKDVRYKGSRQMAALFPRPTQLREDAFAFHEDEQNRRQPTVASRSGGTSVKQTDVYVEDEFSDLDFSDDGDMIAAAEYVELSHSGSLHPKGKSPRRTALSETSGNSVTVSRATSLAKSVQIHPQASQGIRQDHMKYPWSADVLRALKEKFKMSGFRHNQLEAINATLAGQDAFVLMPTGGGKSLCYQLPAVISSGRTRGITIVVSPLISLMQDQVDHLKALKISAVTFNSETSAEYRNKIYTMLQEEAPEEYVQLLYVTPEMMNKSGAFINALKVTHRRRRLARLVIDEAHCVSQWGHDFRPDYKAIGDVRKMFPGVPLIALTATATENVIMDIKHNLGIQGCQVFSQSFNRPNLTYEVRKGKKAAVETIADIINTKYRGQTGIVYTLSRASAEKVALELREVHGISAAHYHACVDTEERARVQRRWQNDEIKVVVATIAFGMGIDKPDVRFVIHYSIPKSLEGYYQETGRAGRDGKNSDCIMFYSYADVKTLRSFIAKNESASEDQKERQSQMLNRVIQFAEDRRNCRRVEILRYFGETFEKADCNKTCDNCKSPATFKRQDFSHVAVAALNVVRAVPKKMTVNHVAELLLGRKCSKLSALEAEKVAPYKGVVGKMKKSDVEKVIESLFRERALTEHNVIDKEHKMAIQYLEAGPTASSFMSGQRRLFLELVVGEDDLIEAPVPKKRTKRGPTARTRQMPPSTNVSSPVRGRVRKKSAAKDNVPLGGVSRHGNGYAKDDFVVSDDANETSDDDDGFEPANISRPRTWPAGQRGKRNVTLGPPISNDSRLQGASLSELHIDVATSFVHDAKVLEESIRNKHGLRRPLFSENNLREMAIRWTLTLSDMKKIDGINQEAVDRFGKKFLPMIRSYNDQYLEMTNDDDEGQPPSAQSRHADVIDISDDEDEPDDDDFDDEDAEEALMMSSKYFDLAASAAPSRAPADAQSSKVQAWHEDLERLAGQQSQKKRSATPSSGRGSRSGAGRGSRPRGPGGGRKVSRAGAGVTKRAGAMGSRLGSTASGSAGSKGGGPRSVAGGGLFGDRAGKGSGSGSGSGSASAIPLMPY